MNHFILIGTFTCKGLTQSKQFRCRSARLGPSFHRIFSHVNVFVVASLLDRGSVVHCSRTRMSVILVELRLKSLFDRSTVVHCPKTPSSVDLEPDIRPRALSLYQKSNSRLVDVEAKCTNAFFLEEKARLGCKNSAECYLTLSLLH